MNKGNACPECGGYGRTFTPVKDDCRLEQVCPLCAGTGRADTALYRKLAGEDVPDRESNREVAYYRAGGVFRQL